jgi:GNAT superfamily N-acetyltransferase
MVRGTPPARRQEVLTMDISIRALEEQELDDAERIFRLAFGTFLGLPDPLQFSGDCAYVRTRWLADPSASFAARRNGELLGSNFAAHWGSFGCFGPLTVRPELWEHGVAKRLLAATMDRFDSWGLTHAGLFTFAQSAKHIGLYQRFGFYPRFLTAVMAKAVTQPAGSGGVDLLSAASDASRDACLAECRAVASTLLDGLDVASEIRSVQSQALGDTILLSEGGHLHGFAVCHVGAGTEAGSGACYVKFGAVRPGSRAAGDFERLLDACERFAAARGVAQLVAGVNTAREGAYRSMLGRGFRTIQQGVAMQRPNEPGFNRPDVFAIDDWR